MNLMKRIFSFISISIFCVICFGCLTSCSREKNVLRIAIEELKGKFNPFFSTTEYDRTIERVTQVYLFALNQEDGTVIKDSKTQKKGVADVTESVHLFSDGNNSILHNIDKEPNILNNYDDVEYTEYDISMIKNLYFTNGENATADDVIFNYYTYFDPSVVSSIAVSNVDVVGLSDYNENVNYPSNEEIKQYTELLTNALNKIKKYVVNSWNSNPKVKINIDSIINDLNLDSEEVDIYNYIYKQINVNTNGMTKDDLNNEFNDNGEKYSDFYSNYEKEWKEIYKFDQIINHTDNYKIDINNAVINYIIKQKEDHNKISTKGVDYIKGIIKKEKYELAIRVNKYDPTALSNLNIEVLPLSVYGYKEQFNYGIGDDVVQHHNFGFPKGDSSKQEAQNSHPVGAGPFIFQNYSNKIVTYIRNEKYIFGVAKVKYLQFIETDNSKMITGINSNSFDISTPELNKSAVKAINKSENVYLDTISFPGYAYIALNAKNVYVGKIISGDSDNITVDNSNMLDVINSADSINFRKGFSVIFAACRYISIQSYYAGNADVLEYPISKACWATPTANTIGFEQAFSKTIDDKPIYKQGDKFENIKIEAKNAAKQYFESAGCKFDNNGKLSSLPEGAKKTYTFSVPGHGGPHPAVNLYDNANEILMQLGFSLILDNPAQSSTIWDKMTSGTAEMWGASWSTSNSDPDLSLTFTSSQLGKNNSSYTTSYDIDNNIQKAQSSNDRSIRKNYYFKALKAIIDTATIIPYYQRIDAKLYSTKRIKESSIFKMKSSFYDYLYEINKIELN